LGFNTGLDSRAFAQAKLAQFITGPGTIVRAGSPDSITLWNAAGVLEAAGDNGKPSMVIWGPLFEGERLDVLLAESGQQDRALAAVVRWIQAILALGESHAGDAAPAAPVSFWPCAAFMGDDAVFFAPPDLARHCLLTNENGKRYVHPDKEGMNAAAFTVAVMLYQIFAGTHPFPSTPDETLMYQDMREGNVLPVHLAVPGLNAKLAALINRVLLPPDKKEMAVREFAHGNVDGKTLLAQFIEALRVNGQTVTAASLVQPVPDAERLLLEKEKAKFLKIKTASITTRRFVARNKTFFAGGIAAIAAVLMIVFSMLSKNAALPTTAGMEPIQVIESYYNAFGELDHQMMEACVLRGTGKDDIGMVVNLFVISRAKWAYERGEPPMLISAREWQESGGDTGSGAAGAAGSQPFGATDLRVETLAMNEAEGVMRYRVDYIFWLPNQPDEEAVW
jgi:hypothetical protein